MSNDKPSTPAAAPPKTAAEQVQIAKRMTMRRLFESQRPELAKLLPKGMALDRFERMALTECVKQPALFDCTAESWALALQKCAAQGLYPDSELGYMYLIPRKKGKSEPGIRAVIEVNAQRGYQGDMKLWRNTGEIADIWAEVVYEKDAYKVTKGLDRNITHEPYDGDDDPGPLRACYAVAKFKDGTLSFVTLTKRDVMRHKASASANTDKDDSPWVKHEAAMWMKTAIHELNKWMPKTSEKAEDAARTINEEAVPGAVIDIEGVAVSMDEPQPSALEKLTERLKAERAPDPEKAEPPAEAPAPKADPRLAEPPKLDPKDCKHESVPPSRVDALPPGRSITCPQCEAQLTRPERVPGEDDGEPEPAAKPRARQGRLSE